MTEKVVNCRTLVLPTTTHYCSNIQLLGAASSQTIYDLNSNTWQKMENPHRLIDLFCGAGGMTLGFVEGESGGKFKSVFAIDNDFSATKTYQNRFGNHAVCEDIEAWLDSEEVPEAEVVIGGPPCQGFSLLNKKRKGDKRRALWEPYLDIVEASGAHVFVMENVPGLLKSAEFHDIRSRAEELDFEIIASNVLNTADYGVPQTRKRAIAIGVKRTSFANVELPSFPPPTTHRSPNIESELPLWNTVESAIKNLAAPKGIDIRNERPPYNLHFGRTPTPKSLERYRAVPHGGNRFDLQRKRPDITPECWKRKTSGGTDLFGRLWWDRPSVTIRTEFFKPEKGRYLHPDQDRPITHREAARLMTFPDHFIFEGTKIEIARQIGNAVPPLFASHIAKFVDALLACRQMKATEAA